jgi:hypothetical protein
MKFIYLKSKVRSCELIALIIMGGSVPTISLAADDCQTVAHEQSIIITCKEKFDTFFDEFSTIFKDSFSLESTEMFNVTGAKLLRAQKTLEELIHWLQEQAHTIATTQGKQSVDYQYVNELLSIANEFFKKRFVPIVTTFNKHFKENITKFIGTLKKSIDPIVNEASFKSLKKHFDTLKHLCEHAGYTELAEKYNLLWQVALEARAEYLNSANPAVLSKWRHRTPK